MSDEARREAEKWVDEVFSCDHDDAKLCEAAKCMLLRVVTRIAEGFREDFCQLKEEPVVVKLSSQEMATWEEAPEAHWLVEIVPVKGTEKHALGGYAHELAHVVLRDRDPRVPLDEYLAHDLRAWEKAAEWFPKEAEPSLKGLAAAVECRRRQ